MMISAAEELLSVTTTLTAVCLVHPQTILLNQKLVLMESLPDKPYPLGTHMTVMANPTKSATEDKCKSHLCDWSSKIKWD